MVMQSEGAESVREETMVMRTVRSETSHEFRTSPFPSDVNEAEVLYNPSHY